MVTVSQLATLVFVVGNKNQTVPNPSAAAPMVTPIFKLILMMVSDDSLNSPMYFR